jgi:hypothetical protein
VLNLGSNKYEVGVVKSRWRNSVYKRLSMKSQSFVPVHYFNSIFVGTAYRS